MPLDFGGQIPWIMAPLDVIQDQEIPAPMNIELYLLWNRSQSKDIHCFAKFASRLQSRKLDLKFYPNIREDTVPYCDRKMTPS